MNDAVAEKLGDMFGCGRRAARLLHINTEVSRPSRANFIIIEMLLFSLQTIFIDYYVTTTTYT